MLASSVRSSRSPDQEPLSGQRNCFLCSETNSTTSSAVKPKWTASVRKRSNASWSRSLRTFRESSLPGRATNTPSPGRVFKIPSRSNSVYTRAMVFGLTTNVAGKLADRRQPLVGLEFPPRDAFADLTGQLPADGRPAAGIDEKLHRHLTNCTSYLSTERNICQEAFFGKKGLGIGD